MLKSSLIAASLLALSSGGLLAGLEVASAQPAPSHSYCEAGGYGCTPNAYSYENDGGLGRFCPPGQYPHAWPSAGGIRCQFPDGSFGAFRG